MKKIIFILATILLFSSCESKEEKVQKAISQELKGFLYNFESYEPIRTKIDSAFYSPYTDLEIKNLILSISKPLEAIKEAKEDYDDALSGVALWESSYMTSYGRHRYDEEISKRDAALKKIEKLQSQLVSGIKELYQRIQADLKKKDEFIGWFVTQRFKCKTGGGYPTFGDAVFVFNDDITECLFFMTTEEYDAMCTFVDQLVSIPEDEFLERIEELDFDND